MVENKKYSNIDEYINHFPENVKKNLEKIRQIIRDAAPEAQEAISYQIPTFKLNGKNLVHFAAYEKHVGFYPTPSGIEKYKEELAQYKPAKGSVKFPLNKSIPFDLIRKIVKFRKMEELSKK